MLTESKVKYNQSDICMEEVIIIPFISYKCKDTRIQCPGIVIFTGLYKANKINISIRSSTRWGVARPRRIGLLDLNFPMINL